MKGLAQAQQDDIIQNVFDSQNIRVEITFLDYKEILTFTLYIYFHFTELKLKWTLSFVDPLGRPTVTASRDHCFCTMSSVRPYIPIFQNLAKQNKAKTMFATGETVGLAEWIIDDTCLVKTYVRTFSFCTKNQLSQRTVLQEKELKHLFVSVFFT